MWMTGGVKQVKEAVRLPKYPEITFSNVRNQPNQKPLRILRYFCTIIPGLASSLADFLSAIGAPTWSSAASKTLLGRRSRHCNFWLVQSCYPADEDNHIYSWECSMSLSCARYLNIFYESASWCELCRSFGQTGEMRRPQLHLQAASLPLFVVVLSVTMPPAVDQ